MELVEIIESDQDVNEIEGESISQETLENIQQSVYASEIYLQDINNNLTNINNIAQASFSLLLVVIGAVIVVKTFFTGW